MLKTLIYVRRNGTEPELSDLRRIVTDRGDTVVAAYWDDPAITGKGRYKGWRSVMSGLPEADMVVVGCAADLPVKTVPDLFKVLSLLNEHGVGLCLHREGINTDDGAAAILSLTTAFRAAKRSEAIRRGIAKARKAGKAIGRPRISNHVRNQVRIALQNGAGIRRTARRFKVSAGSILNIAREAETSEEKLAA
jgi:DNA invertase Pin-like site-specific DNA recombinase